MADDHPTRSGFRLHFSRHSLQILLFAGVFLLVLNGFFVMHFRQSRANAEAEARASLELALEALTSRAALLAQEPPDVQEQALRPLLPESSTFTLSTAAGTLCLEPPQKAPDAPETTPPFRAVKSLGPDSGALLEQPRAAGLRSWNLAARTALTGIFFADLLLGAFLFFLGLFASKARRFKADHKHSEEMLVALFENANQFVALLDPNGMVLKVNQAALQCIDKSRPLVLGMPFWMAGWWGLPEDSAAIKLAVTEALAGRPSKYQSRNIHASGAVFPVEVSIKPLVFEQDHVEYILVEWRDISELVAAVLALEESRSQLMDMAASVPGVLFRLEEVDPINPSLSQRFRFTFISQRFAKLFKMPGDLVTLDRIADMMQPSSAFLHSLDAALEKPPRWEHISRYTDHNGRSGWVRLKARIKATEDTLQRLVINGVFLDETEHVEAEESLKKAHNILQEQERMVSLGSMVAGVAHEINTPLGVALTAASQLDKDVSQMGRSFEDQTLTAEQLAEFITDATEATRLMVANCTRAADLVRSFKQVAADQSVSELRTIDLKEYLEDLVLSLRPQLKRTPHSLIVDCPEGLQVVCDPGALAQIVSNLVMNSLAHAFNGHGQAGVMRIGVQPAAHGNLTLRFEDNGAGMPDSVRRRAFDPFFTTRRGQGGTGLGLHIVYNLVINALFGSISLASSEGEGTVFTIQFPQTPPAAA